jgi:hypothetical protein
MRFMLTRKADEDTEAGAKPSPQVLADMGKYMDEMGKAGIVLAGEGLQPSSWVAVSSSLVDSQP